MKEVNVMTKYIGLMVMVTSLSITSAVAGICEITAVLGEDFPGPLSSYGISEKDLKETEQGLLLDQCISISNEKFDFLRERMNAVMIVPLPVKEVRYRFLDPKSGKLFQGSIKEKI
jgi:hypothetical protein